MSYGFWLSSYPNCYEVSEPLALRMGCVDGGVQFVFGGSEVYWGAALSATGVGAVVGVPMILNGIDDAQSAARRLLGDGDAVSAKYAGTYAVATADRLSMGMDLGSSIVGGVLHGTGLGGIWTFATSLVLVP